MQFIQNDNTETTVGADLAIYSNLVAATPEFYKPLCLFHAQPLALVSQQARQIKLFQRLPSLLQFAIDAWQLLNL